MVAFSLLQFLQSFLQADPSPGEKQDAERSFYAGHDPHDHCQHSEYGRPA